MFSSMLVNAILWAGVAVVVVAPLVWAIRTSPRDVPAGRPAPERPRRTRQPAVAFRRPEPAPRFGGRRSGQAWPAA